MEIGHAPTEAATPRGPLGSRSRARNAVLLAEFETDRKRLTVVYALASVFTVVFGVWDVIWPYATDDPVNLTLMLGSRFAFGAFAALGFGRLRTAKEISRAELAAWLNVLGPLLSVLCALLCLGGPGVESLYPSATGLVACIYAFIPRRYIKVLASAVATLVAFPLTFYIAAIFWDPAREMVAGPRFVLLTSAAVSLLAGMLGFLVYASHLIWAMRREVFEARTIGRYRVRERIGQGGMGEVWRAFDTTLRRDVALKVLHPDHRDDIASQRFEREVQATIALTHPHTVRVYDYGVQADGLSYYAMELLSGEPMDVLLEREGRLSTSRALHFALSAARALAEAHARGIVHRDIKPANLFITSAGDEPDFLKVLDFGVARLIEGDAQGTLTDTGQLAGTPHYIAPEVLGGAPAGCPADVYSLGIVLYQMLTGRSPYTLHEPGSPAHMVASLTTPPVRPSHYVQLPEEIEQVVMRCLEKDPDRRYPDARELAAALLHVQMLDGADGSGEGQTLPRQSTVPPQ